MSCEGAMMIVFLLWIRLRLFSADVHNFFPSLQQSDLIANGMRRLTTAAWLQSRFQLAGQIM